MKGIEFQRVLRTSSSERYLLQKAGKDVAALDIHYLPNATVDATLIVLDTQAVPENTVPDLLKLVDEMLLPQVDMKEGNLSFTVVVGRIVGAFQPVKDEVR